MVKKIDLRELKTKIESGDRVSEEELRQLVEAETGDQELVNEVVLLLEKTKDIPPEIIELDKGECVNIDEDMVVCRGEDGVVRIGCTKENI